MNREGALGIILIALLLGGIVLFARRPVALSHASAPLQTQTHNPGNIQVVPVQAEPRYQNKETRQIEYNEDNLPIRIVITRDYAIT